MGKDLRFSVLLDYYGSMLTDKQRDVIELYYNEDLSLAEIAEHEKITRQGVRDSIKRAEEILLELEGKLGLADRLRTLALALDEMTELAGTIHRESDTYNYSRAITESAARIKTLAEEGAKLI